MGAVVDGRGLEGGEELLPWDVLENVQARLPALNYFQSRLVSKFWHRSLLCARFREMHAKLSPKEEWLLCIPYCADMLPSTHAYSPAAGKWLKLPMEGLYPEGGLTAGGLLCFVATGEPGRPHFTICNPLTGSRMSVPLPCSQLRLVGFVLDEASEEYKIYVISFDSPVSLSLVYDSRTKEWVVTGTVDVAVDDEINGSVAWRGSLWVVLRRRNSTHRLYTCKVEEGVWRSLFLPIPEEVGCICPDLAVYQDRLLLLGRVDDDPDLHVPDKGMLKIWELKSDVTGEMCVAHTLTTVGAYFGDYFTSGSCFVALKDLLYIQLSSGSSRIAICDLSTSPSHWWVVPPYPSPPIPSLRFFTLRVAPRLHALYHSL